MESTEGTIEVNYMNDRTLKINWTIMVRVSENAPDRFWLQHSPIMSVSYDDIPYESRKHLKVGDWIKMTLDLESRSLGDANRSPTT